MERSPSIPQLSTPFRHAHGAAWQVRLEQVVAMDVNFALLTRVWCVAELVEADHLHIHQVSLKSTKCCHVPVKPGIVEKEICDIWHMGFFQSSSIG